MKICFCISELNSGGAERVAASLANSFCKQKIEVTILLISVTTPESFYHLHKNIRLEVLSENTIYRGFQKIKKMKCFFKNNNFDVVISFLPNPTIYSYYSLKHLSTKLICSERSNPKKYPLIKRCILKHIFNNANGTVFQTSKSMNFYKKNGIIIYNPVDINLTQKEMKHEKVISFVGSYRKVKNFPLLFKSFKLFLSTNSLYKLNIYGADSSNKKLKYLLRKFNIENSVCIKGKIQNLKEEINRSSLYVSTSLFEGMSNSVLEAASLGIPCVVTNCDIGGNQEIAKYYKNVCLSSFKPQLFCEDMNKMLCHFTKKEIKKEFSIDYVTKQWEKYILSIIGLI